MKEHATRLIAQIERLENATETIRVVVEKPQVYIEHACGNLPPHAARIELVEHGDVNVLDSRMPRRRKGIGPMARLERTPNVDDATQAVVLKPCEICTAKAAERTRAQKRTERRLACGACLGAVWIPAEVAHVPGALQLQRTVQICHFRSREEPCRHRKLAGTW